MGERATPNILYADLWLSNPGKYSKIRSGVNFDKELRRAISGSGGFKYQLPLDGLYRPCAGVPIAEAQLRSDPFQWVGVAFQSSLARPVLCRPNSSIHYCALKDQAV